MVTTNNLFAVFTTRYDNTSLDQKEKQAMVRKLRNQRASPTVKVKVGNDQEMTQSERITTPKTELGKN